jgi:hypothetical protein
MAQDAGETVGADQPRRAFEPDESELRGWRGSTVAGDVAVVPLRIAGIDTKPDLIYARFLASRAGLRAPARYCHSWHL